MLTQHIRNKKIHLSILVFIANCLLDTLRLHASALYICPERQPRQSIIVGYSDLFTRCVSGSPAVKSQHLLYDIGDNS